MPVNEANNTRIVLVRYVEGRVGDNGSFNYLSTDLRTAII